MHLAFDIFQGMGIAAAVGIRPFLPALAVGALAAGGVEIHFSGTDLSFLQSAPFLIAMGVAAAVLLVAERRFRGSAARARPMVVTVGICALVLGALLFAGSLARGHYTSWPGAVGGVLCASLAIAATVPLLLRVSSRLGGQDADVVPLYAEGVAVLVGVLSVVAPPVGLVVVLLLLWLFIAGRRRTGQKYAGLRILR